MKDLVSIVMATYKQAKFLNTALLSCFMQTHQPIEVIVVPVRGDTETERVLYEFPFPIKIVWSEKADYVHQRNLGIKEAQGTYITLADSDDAYLPNKVESEVSIAKRENALIVYSGFFITDEKLNIKQVLIPPDFSRERLLSSCIITDLCLVHRSIYEEFGLFNESYGEVAFYNHWLKVAEKYPDKIKRNPIPTFLYRTHPEQMHRTLNKQIQLLMRQKVKHESLTRKPL